MKEAQKISLCKAHSQPLSMYCNSLRCQVFLCPECVDSHTAHLIISIKELKNTLVAELSHLIQKGESTESAMKSREQTLKSQAEIVTVNMGHLLTNISTAIQTSAASAADKAGAALRDEHKIASDQYQVLMSKLASGIASTRELCGQAKKLGEDIGTDCDSLKAVAAKIKEQRTRIDALAELQKSLEKEADVIANQEKGFTARAALLSGRFEAFLRSVVVGKEEESSPGSGDHVAKAKCEEIIEGWKGFMDAHIEQVEERLEKLRSHLDPPPKELQEIADLLAEMRKVYAVKIGDEISEGVEESKFSPKSLPASHVSTLSLRERAISGVGKPCMCDQGEKIAQLDCGHGLCMGCTVRGSILARQELSDAKAHCKVCGKDSRISISRWCDSG